MSTEERNLELTQTLDDAWNTQDVETFRQHHKADVVVRWPGQPGPSLQSSLRPIPEVMDR